MLRTRSSKRCTTKGWRIRPTRPDPARRVSGIPGAVHILDSSFDSLVFNDVNIISGLFIEGDVYLDDFVFSGSLTLRGETIVASGPLDVEQAFLSVGDGNSGESAGCNPATLRALSFESGSGIPCIDSEDLRIDSGRLVEIDGGLITAVNPIPEPSAALLFAVGRLVAARAVCRRSNPSIDSQAIALTCRRRVESENRDDTIRS